MSTRLADNLSRVRQRIAAAAARRGRDAAAVRLIAVTKYVGPARIKALVEAGCLDLGESRPQDLWRKVPLLADQPVRWHLVGHLQRNKAARTLPHLALLHSGDSLRLLEAANQVMAPSGRRLPVLIEVNISGDPAKHGFAPHEPPKLLGQLAALEHLEICGLMGMAGRDAGPEQAARQFASLRQLRDQLQAAAVPGLRWSELSMGMSGDFEIAIEEGATMVRIGSALFEGLEGWPP